MVYLLYESDQLLRASGIALNKI